jgi:hypothetical protein
MAQRRAITAHHDQPRPYVQWTKCLEGFAAHVKAPSFLSSSIYSSSNGFRTAEILLCWAMLEHNKSVLGVATLRQSALSV